jgi:hypothetical protein
MVSWPSTVLIDLILSLMIRLTCWGDLSPFTSGGAGGLVGGPLQETNRASNEKIRRTPTAESFDPFIFPLGILIDTSYVKQNHGIVYPFIGEFHYTSP